tara:strand:- start:1691 stop:2308 length:618 start_codon:yes stop_codon:yes gene_type:complete
MAVLNSKFDILRGWPDGSAVAEDFTKNATADTSKGVYRHGNFVALGFGDDLNDPQPYTACGQRESNKAVANVRLGLIIEGDEETSSQMSNTVTCLIGGGYMVRLHLEGQFSQNAYGKAAIPNGRDQYVLTRQNSDGADGTGLALQANNDNFALFASDDAVLTITPGCGITVIDGVACARDVSNAAEVTIGTCLKVGSDFIEILVH